MKYYIFIFGLLLSGIVPTLAQNQVGRIPYDCPDVAPPTFEFNLTQELIAFMSTAQVFNSVEDIYIHTYQKSDEVFDKLQTYYDNILLENGWDKFTDDVNFRIYYVVNTDEKVGGIFAIVRTNMSVYLLNIVGQIPQQQIGTLLANLNLLGIWVPELRSLGEQIETEKPRTESIVWNADDTVLNSRTTILRIFNDSTKSPTKFSGTMQETHFGDWTYNSHPISRIEIKSHTRSRGDAQKQRINAVKDILFEGNIHRDGPVDFAILLNRLLNSEAAVYIQKVTVDTDEKQIQLYLEEVQDDDHIKLSQQFRTQEDEPIHEIQLYGNLEFDVELLKSVLEEGPSEIDYFMKTLPETFPEVGTASIEQVEFGQRRIAKITVLVEKPIELNPYATAIPRLGFNRVSGWELGARVETGIRSQPSKGSSPNSSSIDYDWNREVQLTRDNPKIFAQFGYGFGNKQRYYSIGGNQIWGKREKWNIGLSVRYQRAITTLASDIYAGYEERGLFLLRLVGIPDHQDYYLRTGTEASFHWQPSWSNRIRISLASEKHENLHKTTDWHFLNWRSTSKVRENLEATPANIRSITVKSDFNSRRSYLGWHNTYLVEYSHPVLGSDYDWTRAQMHLRYGHPFGRNQIRSRFVLSSVFGKKTEAQKSKTLLPIQRQFIIGGLGTLNGYPLNTFIGDAGYLFNTEYIIGLPAINNIEILNNFYAVLFVDIGQVWNKYRDKWDFEPKGSAGIGLQISTDVDIFRFNVAKAFDSDQDIQYNLMFFYSF